MYRKFEDKTMKNLVNKTKLLIIGVCYGALVSMPATADDTEIYTGAGVASSGVQANVLLLLDTSLSMGKQVVSSDPYDASITYSALPAVTGTPCFDATKVYRVSGTIPNKARLYCAGDNSKVDGIVNFSAFYCDDASMIAGGVEPATSVGFYTGRIGQYRGNPKRWRQINRTNQSKGVDCSSDQGVHGQTTGGPVFATALNNQASAWTSTSSDQKDWSGFNAKTVYTGNYLNYMQTRVVTSAARIEVIRDAMKAFVQGASGINLGLMPFSQRKLASPSGSLGGMVEVEIADVTPAHKQKITDRLDFYGIQHDPTDTGLDSGHNNLVLGTPLSQQYYEAMRYFQGGNVEYGLNSLPAPSVSTSLQGGSTAVPLASGTKYKSPISDECQKNYIMVLTDGQPYRDPLTVSQLTSMGVTDTSCQLECTSGGCGLLNCLDHLALAAGGLDQSTAFANDQNISTFTIAFGSNIGILNATSAASRATTQEGASFVANDGTQLLNQLNAVAQSVLDSENTFSSPAVSVNAFNRAVHLNDLYFTLFSPSEGPHWNGNLKKYKLKTKKDINDFDNDLDTDELIPFIEDARPDEAIDPATGFFDGNALSYWSDPLDPDGNDGKDVDRGGMVGEFTNTRNIYTYTGAYSGSDGVFTPADSDIIKPANVVAKLNKNDVTDVLLGISPTDTITDGAGNTVLLHEALLDWAAGIDVLDQNLDGTITDARQVMGDPLHSQPAIVQYGSNAATDFLAFVATNDGYLHAVNTHDGTELWSFIPQELLPLLATNMEDKSGDPKGYGLDGNVVAWIHDDDKDGTITAGTDHVYLYIGMRRGGDKIFALDVTVRNDPQLLWVIDGGIAGTAYEELGQTWSTMNVQKIKNGASSDTVLVFGGGYDDNQDNSTGAAIERNIDGIGRTVFIADATSGAHLWSARGTTGMDDMKYSIPARVVSLDMSGDGNMDRMYATDMGGQMFRFDIDETLASFSAASVSGGRIADLAIDNSAQDARRFYYPPDVAIVAEKGKAAYLGIALSSGYRAHPTETRIHDRIYLLKDRNVFDKPATYTMLTESDLYNATLNLASSRKNDTAAVKAATATALSSLDSMEGWYIELDNEQTPAAFVGEKGLAEPLIVEGGIIVTTFVPDSGTGGAACTSKEGSGKVFFLDIVDATASYPSSLDTRSDRHIPLANAGIPPSPNVIITDDGVPTTCIGTECRSLGDAVGLRKTYWYEVEQ